MSENMSFGEYLRIKRQEETDLTREQVADETTISYSRLEKIERGLLTANAQDVVELAELYKLPDLCNYYCTHECRIGKDTVPEVRTSTLSEIVLGMLSSLNALERQRDRLIDITADGVISDDELKDFADIQKQLENIDMTVESLKLWVANTIAEGKINEEKLKQFRN